MHLSKNYNAPNFSRVYIEKGVVDHPNTRKILSKIKPKHSIIIDDYAQVFNRNNQNYMMQKNAVQCILAEKKFHFYYDGSPYCEDFEQEKFYYCSPVLNCLYNCHYCYLKALHPSAHCVIFVNNDDLICSVKEDLLQDGQPVYLALSYDSDLLALEGITHFIEAWFPLLRANPHLTIEVKTKANTFPFAQVPDNLIWAWSLLPQTLIDYYEPRTPSLAARIQAIRQAQRGGARVRLSFEPLLPFPNLVSHYQEMVSLLAQYLDFNQIRDINIGGFRISQKQYKKFVKTDPNNPVLVHPTILKENTHTFSEDLIQSKVLKSLLTSYFPEEKIRIFS
ncbi:MAG: radical SAM protein [Eubacteriaceae bacterium]|jgi:spore photoproduct lyase|nr:radical SAM protein [Eubacteriaceae bacterium]